MNAATTETETLTNPEGEAERFASWVNHLRENHEVLLVNGREVASATPLARVATAFGTGSVSVRVKARRGNGFAQVWVKPEQSVEVAFGQR